ncbi:hypothetical protein D515_02690 [Grimontia indica]|uniref:Uncharacterized protein n=1 Tax=Grimontia indica TaxID=1056512 RepID=R1GQN0_9GAMM|nr:hypothetical protein D515_02690 [Grimontia indica]
MTFNWLFEASHDTKLCEKLEVVAYYSTKALNIPFIVHFLA